MNAGPSAGLAGGFNGRWPQFEFYHVGISVPDLEVAARWWEHMSGFKITKRFRIEPADADVILLSKGNLNVELFQASGAAPLPHDRRIPIKDIGTHGTKHAAFRINYLDEFLPAVRADAPPEKWSDLKYVF